ncbi:MAG: hypothetical protein HOW97_09560 [Catenulispora sp.]|nr:hypothetical protein [Catenulispora sp.]
MRLERLRQLKALRTEYEQRRNDARPGSESAARFYSDPVGFATTCIDWGNAGGLTTYQCDLLAHLPTHRRVAARGPHGLGKTTTEAVAVLWFALTRDAAGVDWKVATTAGAWRQLERYLWPEIKKWAKKIRWETLGRRPLDERTELLSLNMKLRHGTAFAVASSNAELIEGVHADSVLYIFDESKAIGADTFQAAEGAFSGADPAGGIPEAFALACSTPGEPNGIFYDIHRRAPGLEDWWPRHVTLAEAAAAGRVSLGWAEQRKRQWGENSAAYQNRVLGEFYTSDEDGVIPLGWIEAANDRWRVWDEAGRPETPGRRALGVDVARSGADKTVMALLDGNIITELRRTDREDTMQTTGRVHGIINAAPGRMPVVDVIGVGAGVVDRLRELKVPVEAFNASESTGRTDRSGELGFANKRSAAWWNLRELLDPAYGHDLALPPDDLLTGDLTAPHWRVLSGGKIQVESKDDIRKRIGRSTDDGDAVVQAAWDDDTGAQAWIDYARRKAEALAGQTDTSETTTPPPDQTPVEDPAAARKAARDAAFRAQQQRR